MKIETTMPKLAGNSSSPRTTTAPPPSQWINPLIHCHLNVAKESSPHHARAIRAICRTSDSSNDCHSTPRSFGSVVSWVKASSKARIIYACRSLGPNDACRLQRTDLLGREAALLQHFIGVLATLGGGSLHAFLGTREARRGGGLREAQHVDIGVARLGVCVLRGLLHGENRCEADVGAFHDRAPFVARLALEHALEPALELRPRLAIHLRRQRLALQAGLLEQQIVELRLDRADRDELAVLGFVGVVEMRAAVQHVAFARLVVP